MNQFVPENNQLPQLSNLPQGQFLNYQQQINPQNNPQKKLSGVDLSHQAD
jgi:hypothetical protein